MNKRSDVTYVTVEGVVQSCTPKAIRLHVASANESLWIPRSVCNNGANIVVKDEDISVAEWWLEKQGLEGI